MGLIDLLFKANRKRRKAYFKQRAYLEACARAGGKAPENLGEFLPWNWSAQKKAAWSTREQAP